MVEAFNQNYDVDIILLIEALAQVFDFNGLEIRGHNYFLKCPFHSMGKEKDASANFKLVEPNLGAFYCFGCGTKGSLSQILVKLFKTKRAALDWLNSNFTQLEQKPTRVVHKMHSKVLIDTQRFELASSIFTNKTRYYDERGIPESLVKKFKLGYSKVRNSVVFPVFNKEGDLIFYSERFLSKETKQKWYIPRGSKPKIFGADQVTSRSVVVCESAFNALTCWKFNKQAVALFGARFDGIRFDLLKLPCLKFIIAFDGDDAGREKAVLLKKFLLENNKLVEVLEVDSGKDINDFANLTEEEFEKKWKEWSH